MKQTVLTAIVVSLLCAGPAFAKDVMSERYFSVNTSAPLNKTDQQALKIAKQHNANGVKPVAGEFGSVEFSYGDSQPTIICAPLKVTDIALQEGEKINSLQIGDAVRWTLDPMISGEGSTERIHIVVKPKDVGLETNLIVATNKRVYNIRLKSTKTQYLPRVSFSYPEIEMARWQALTQQKAEEHERGTIPETNEYLGNLDFNYDIDGSASWKPVRVYNDGQKMVLELPKSALTNEVPTLLVLRDEGGIFSDEESEIVNYRLQGNRFIVDQIPKKVILITGVGSKQERVTVTHLSEGK